MQENENSGWILELPARLEQPIQHIQQRTFLPCFGLPSKTIVGFQFLAFFEILDIEYLVNCCKYFLLGHHKLTMTWGGSITFESHSYRRYNFQQTDLNNLGILSQYLSTKETRKIVRAAAVEFLDLRDLLTGCASSRTKNIQSIPNFMQEKFGPK